MKRKICFYALLFCMTALVLAGCAAGQSASGSFSTTGGEGLTPSETVQAAFDALKKGDPAGFQQYFITEERRDGKLIKDNYLFGKTPDEESTALAASIGRNLSWQLGEEEQEGDNASVTATITNRDFSGTMEQFIKESVESDTISLNSFLEKADGAEISRTLTISLARHGNGWAIQLDYPLVNAVCGGLFPENGLFPFLFSEK